MTEGGEGEEAKKDGGDCGGTHNYSWGHGSEMKGRNPSISVGNQITTFITSINWFNGGYVGSQNISLKKGRGSKKPQALARTGGSHLPLV